MSKWNNLRSKIIWPKEFFYVIENEGYNNKFGFSYVIKYNGNIIHKNFKKKLNKIEKLTNIVHDQANNTLDDYENDSYDYEVENDVNKIDQMNQILLRLNDDKEVIEDKIDKINIIKEEYDIIVKNIPHYMLRLDFPFINVESEYLIEILKRECFKESFSNYNNQKKKIKKNTKECEGRPYKTYLYNIKIIESEETIIGNREFIYFESGIEDIKINSITNEGNYIKKILYKYKEECKINSNNQETEECKEGDEHEIKEKKEIDYENLSVLPYSDAIVLKKKLFNEEVNVAGFITPFMLNGNIKKMIENIDKYSKYEFDNKMIYTNLCNMIQLMCYLENRNIIHGNIKPTNIFIGNNGYNLLLGGFVPKVKLQNYYFYAIQKRIKISKYISPEFFLYLNKKLEIVKSKKKKIKHIEKYFIKNDIFCLGLCFYYILTMSEDIINYINAEHVLLHKVENLKKRNVIPELFFLLKAMLSYDSSQRASWSILMNLINEQREREKEKGERKGI